MVPSGLEFTTLSLMPHHLCQALFSFMAVSLSLHMHHYSKLDSEACSLHTAVSMLLGKTNAGSASVINIALCQAFATFITVIWQHQCCSDPAGTATLPLAVCSSTAHCCFKPHDICTLALSSAYSGIPCCFKNSITVQAHCIQNMIVTSLSLLQVAGAFAA